MGFTTAILVHEMTLFGVAEFRGWTPKALTSSTIGRCNCPASVGEHSEGFLAGNAPQLEPDLVVLGINSFPHEGYSGVRVEKGGGEGSCCGYS